MFQSLVKKILRLYYKNGHVYKIPFGPNRGTYFEYHDSLTLSIMLGCHEPNTFEVARQLIRPGMCVVDLGANRGYFATFFSKLTGENGRVYAFEPIPSNYAALTKNLDLNKCKNVTPLQMAAADKDGTLSIFLAENPLMASLEASWAGADHGKIDVESITLDKFFEKNESRPDFIKMDIEGGGVFALPGMEKTIDNHKPFLLLESHTPNEDRAIGKILQKYNYQAYRVGFDREVRNLDSDYKDPYGIYDAVVGIPKSKPDIIKALRPDLFQKNRFGQRLHSLRRKN